MRYGQLIIGPAGSGKSNYCRVMQEYFREIGRRHVIVNLDPSAETFNYSCNVDIKDLISTNDVISECDYGPNGGLIFAMEYLIENINWLQEEIDSFGEDTLFIFDCPGQIELFTHLSVMKNIVDILLLWDFRICSVYCLDATFVNDTSKFISGTLTALSAMIQLEIPHINLLSKCDLLDEDTITAYIEKDPSTLMSDCNQELPAKYRKLTNSLCSLLEDYNMVNFEKFSIKDEESHEFVSQQIDLIIQYGEDAEPKMDFDMGNEER